MSAMRLIYGNEKGMVLPLGLMFLAIIALLGSTAVIVTTTDLKIGSNYRASEQAFYAAEAGIQEALYRLSLFDDNTKAPRSGSKIEVNGLTDNNAHINIDPNGLLTNKTDDDDDGETDEIDELNSNSSQGVIAYDNRNWQTKIMLKISDDADTTTTVYTPTIQPSGSWLEYSSSTDDGTALTIEYKKDANDMDGDSNTDEIVFYNADLINPYNVYVDATSPASGQPIVVITSTGKSGGSTKTIQVEATHQPVDINAEAAVMVNMLPNFSGSPVISGFNYDGSVSSIDDCLPNCPDINTFTANTADNHGGGETYGGSPPTHKDDNDITVVEPETDTETEVPYQAKLESSGHKPGIWSTVAGVDPSTGDIWGGNVAGTTSWKSDDVGANTWMTLADMLTLTQEEVDDILASANVTEADMDPSSGKLVAAPQGVIYIDNNDAGDNELDIAAGTPSKENGWGLMYVTGNVKISSAAFQFKGLIYVEGDIKVSGSPLFVGCVAAKGASGGAFASGSPHIIYSYDALTEYANKGMKFVILSWKDEGLT